MYFFNFFNQLSRTLRYIRRKWTRVRYLTAYIEREYIFLDGITRGVKGRGCDDTGEREGARTYVRTMVVEEERRRLPAGEKRSFGRVPSGRPLLHVRRSIINRIINRKLLEFSSNPSLRISKRSPSPAKFHSIPKEFNAQRQLTRATRC